jgi:hypothetical protein
LKFSCVRIFSEYLYQLQKVLFAMIRQLRPPTFFITFTTSVNIWSSLSKTSKKLYVQHYGKNDDTFDKREPVRNDLVTCVWY